MKGLGNLAKETGVRVQTHLSECKPEVAWVAELEPWAVNYTDVYEKTGLLTDKTIIAHGIYLSDEELNVIKRSGAGISHCPNSNNSIRSGNMDAVHYHEFPGKASFFFKLSCESKSNMCDTYWKGYRDTDGHQKSKDARAQNVMHHV